MDVTLRELAAVASSRNVEGPLDAAVWIAAGSLVVSVVSVGLAGLGTWLAHRRATEAMEESKKAVASALWSPRRSGSRGQLYVRRGDHDSSDERAPQSAFVISGLSAIY